MRFLILVTTYQRKQYLTQLVDSIAKHNQSHHTYHVVINDDGSTDGTRDYIKSLYTRLVTKNGNITFHHLYTKNKGSHHATNNLLLYAETLVYDFGFKLDDDLIITKKGWEDLYFRHAMSTGMHHLVHYSLSWSGESKLPKTIQVENVQGALWTFTPDVLRKVGYMDTSAMGKRGHGHIDYTARCCRLGFNNINNVQDAPKANEYIRLHPKQGYMLTPNYDKELQSEKNNSRNKLKLVRTKNRTYVPLPESRLNYIFDNVYILNLERRADKRKKMERMISELKINNAEFFTAIDGATVDVRKYRTAMNNGEIGCYLSHVAIMEDAIKRGFERILILEDDVIPHKDIESVLENAMRSVPKSWDMLYLGSSDWEYSKRNALKIDYTKPYYRTFCADGTFAYGITKLAMIECLRILKSGINSPVDTTLHKYHKAKECYTLHPMAFIADIKDSDIRGERVGGIDYCDKINWNTWNH